LRDTLQRAFGGYGVGFVPIATESAAFRATIGHRYNGFESFTIVHHKGRPFAAGGYCTLPGAGNRVTYTARAGKPQWSVFPRIRLFYRAQGMPRTCAYSLDGRPDTLLALRSTGWLETAVLDGGNARSASFGFPATDSLQLYGVSFEGTGGVVLDNFSLRGHSGMGLTLIADSMHRRFNALQQYRLIVLQYGLNITKAETVQYDWYVPRMVSVIEQIKANFPGASILLMGVPDRSMNRNGSYVTIPAIPALIAVQRRIAKETGIAFWDTYSAMGGKNSMVDWVGQKPPLANKDYTHLNNRGAQKIAQLFSQTLLFQYGTYLQTQTPPR
jgi:lysophospholipase L1-like esterase